MDCYYFSTNVDNATSLCIAPLTDESATAAGLNPTQASGYFLYEKTQTGGLPEVAVIAHLLSEEAALKLSQILNME